MRSRSATNIASGWLGVRLIAAVAVLQVATVLPGFDAWLPAAFTSLIAVSLVSVVALIAAEPRGLCG
ncbi:hypothetical protein GC425_02930 [Corynebacterium sp. zg254]|uniref:Uncharacterized protein n=1 Tax=Corynebacterium zhongnanshanii TaxID=2768834 RepID=A0ABQ6VF94_9CORY|nr:MULTISPECIES: hypothetical protein [Corynebacterium]KAB3523082.1 hypothetical protein F8377_02690 [Corynebacterium zhongnanshanii]MCR5913823.1 hypothetical protein [Corynebacterium sp. zg254]